MPCSFDTAEDGELRCLPHGLPYYAYQSPSYSDAACTHLIFAGDGCATDVSAYAMNRIDSHTCGGVSKTVVYETGPAIHPHDVYWLTPSGDCEAIEAAPMYYGRGAHVSPDHFVKGTIKYEPRTDQLDVSVVVGEDGSRLLSAPVDHITHAACESYPYADGGICLPLPHAVVQGDFADAACSTVAARAPIAACPDAPDPTLVVTVHYQDCGPEPVESIANVSGRLDSASVFRMVDGVCTPIAEAAPIDAAANHFYAVGAAAGADLPLMPRARLRDGRLKIQGYASDAGWIGPPGWDISVGYDEQLGVDCVLVDNFFADKKLRCMPWVPQHWSFADAGCSEPIASIPNACGNEWAANRIGSPDACVGHTITFAQAGAPYDGSATYYETDSGDSCWSAAAPLPGPVSHLTAVSPDTFVGLTDVATE